MQAGQPKESTPLVGEEAPPRSSWLLGLTRAQLRLVRSKERGEPYGCLGLFAPRRAFDTLGQGSACHVRILLDCLYLSVPCVALGYPLLCMHQDAARVEESGTAAAWTTLDFGQVGCDLGLVALFLAFFHYIGIYLMNIEHDVIHKAFIPTEEAVRHALVSQGKKLEESLREASRREPKEEEAEEAEEGKEQRGSKQAEGGVGSPKAGSKQQIMELTQKFFLAQVESQIFEKESKGLRDPGEALEASYAVEGCSVVISGWGRGLVFPSAIMDAVVAAAGAQPVYAVQPTECFQYDEARRKSAVGDRTASGLLKWQERAGLKIKAQLLDYAFLTFASSEEKSRVLLAAKAKTLLPPEHQETCSVQPGPNPLDVIWRSLEATDAERRWSNRGFMVVMTLLALVFSAIMALALTVGALLASNTPFTVLSGDFKRFGYFCVMFGCVIVSVQMLVQPLFCVYDDKGLFCQPSLRLRSCTYTALFAKAGSFWMWVELMIAILIFLFHVELTFPSGSFGGYSFAKLLCNRLHVSDKEINFYFLYNGEVSGNILLAALVETLVAAWIMPVLPRYLIAPFMSTQDRVDAQCRLTNPAHLPFTTSDGMRIIGAVALWSGLFPIATLMMLLYYPIAIFVARTNLLGRFEPGPPTKPLQYRFTFTLYLPVYLLLHLILTYGIYADVQVIEPEELGAGLLPGFGSNAYTTTAKSVHSAGCLLAAFALLFAIPASQKRRALREGVLTPWEILMVFCGCAENDDVDFALGARTSVGVHHMTTPSFFGRTEDQDATSGSGGGGGGEDKDEEMVGAEEKGPNVIRLPDPLPHNSRYQPVRGIDLLDESKTKSHSI